MSKDRALFLEVDVQRDFVEGSLKVKQVHETCPGVGDAPGSANSRFINMVDLSQSAPVLVASVDSHDFMSWEFNTNSYKGPNGEDPKFPPHCVVGTEGWDRMAGERKDAVFIPNVQLYNGNQDAHLAKIDQSSTFIFMKEVYSLFANPNAKLFLKLIAHKCETKKVVVYGIATDYCVDAAVVGLHAEGYEVFVVIDAIAAVDPSRESAFHDKWLGMGIKMVTTDHVFEFFDTKEA